MIQPSTLPDYETLKSWLQSMAALDAIFSPEWDYRYYSYDAHWGPSEQMGSIRNGSGDDVFFLFNQAGCFVKGYSHEYAQNHIASERFYKDIPSAFLEATTEPAFSTQNVSYCAWRLREASQWESAVKEKDLNPDIFFLLKDLDGKAETYQSFVADYFEIESEIDLIKSIFEKEPITQKLAASLNPDIDLKALISQLEEIDFPVKKPSRFKFF